MEFKYIKILESGGAELLPTEGSVLRFTIWIIAGTASVMGAIDYGIVGAIVAAPIMLLDGWAVKVLQTEGENELMAFYAAIKEPLFEWQQTPDDTEVFVRATRHRQLLTESGNSLFAKGKITVEEVYFKDPYSETGYCETFEEFLARRSEMKINYLNDWARRISKTDDAWRKAFLHGQRGIKINGSEVQTAW